MRLVISTPTSIVADVADVVAVRAEDASGSFGILDGHADFLTVLPPSVLSWRSANGSEAHCAVRRGVLTMENGKQLSVAAREAVLSDDLEKLETEVLTRFSAANEEERAARVESAAMRMKAIRRILHYLRAPGAAGSEDRL